MSEAQPARETPAQAREADRPLSIPARTDIADEVQRKAPFATAIGVFGSILAFMVVVAIMEYFTRDLGSKPQGETPEQKIAESRDADKKALETYGYSDAAKKTVHVPIARAMELYVEESKKDAAFKKAASPAEFEGKKAP